MSKLYYYEYEVRGWFSDKYYVADGFIYVHDFGVALMVINGDDRQFNNIEEIKNYIRGRTELKRFDLVELE